MDTVRELADLPDDCLLSIVSFCGAPSLCALGASAKFLHRATNSAGPWRALLRRECGVAEAATASAGSGAAARAAYAHLRALPRGAYVLADDFPFGTLVEVRLQWPRLVGAAVRLANPTWRGDDAGAPAAAAQPALARVEFFEVADVTVAPAETRLRYAHHGVRTDGEAEGAPQWGSADVLRIPPPPGAPASSWFPHVAMLRTLTNGLGVGASAFGGVGMMPRPHPHAIDIVAHLAQLAPPALELRIDAPPSWAVPALASDGWDHFLARTHDRALSLLTRALILDREPRGADEADQPLMRRAGTAAVAAGNLMRRLFLGGQTPTEEAAVEEVAEVAAAAPAAAAASEEEESPPPAPPFYALTLLKLPLPTEIGMGRLDVNPAWAEAGLWAELPPAGLFAGDYGGTYPNHRRVEWMMLRYETVNAAQVERWRLPGNGPGLVNAQGVFIPDVEGGGGGAVGSTWLLGQKVVGDQHVPQGEVSFRVKLREADGRPALIQCAPTAGVRAAWAGEGCLARPGFRGASYVPGEFRVHTDGQVSFRWAGNGNQDAVKFQRVEM